MGSIDHKPDTTALESFYCASFVRSSTFDRLTCCSLFGGVIFVVDTAHKSPRLFLKRQICHNRSPLSFSFFTCYKHPRLSLIHI